MDRRVSTIAGAGGKSTMTMPRNGASDENAFRAACDGLLEPQHHPC